MPKAIVNGKGAKRIRQGHLWIYRSDVVRMEANGGEVVSVFDEQEKFVGKAFFSDKSEITLRFITTKDEIINKEFWTRKIVEASKRRANDEKTTAFRLISSEGDLIPSLIIDNYAGNFVIQTLSQGTEKLKETFVEILRENFEVKAILERNDVKIRELEGLEQVKGVLFGELSDEIIIEQDGIKFYVSLLKGQKTGSFLDQRENHFAARKYAFGKALDCFTFNGGFALNMAETCESVTAIDISVEAVKLGKRNAELNDIKNVKFTTANVLDKLRELEMSGQKFDTIILDPPAFVKSRSAITQAIRGYKEINLRALKLLNRNGILITCSCSFHFNEDMFLEVVEEAAEQTRKRVQLLEKRMQSIDHPVLLGMPESYYLKCFILRVIG
jgi:23S rRNA (cytosine1962-C5)-methyltransferase